MELELNGKKIVVTGAANGIGTAIFTSLLEEGAYPIGIDKESFNNSELEERIGSYNLPKDYLYYQGDVSDDEVMKPIYKKLGLLYGLVNNAGLLGGDQTHGGRTIQAWHTMMNNHATAAFISTELAIKNMNEGGSIVNIGSLELDMAAPGVVLYTAAKGALLGMTVAYSTTLAENKIRVNMVSPGNVNTKRNMAQYTQNEDLIKGFENRTPLKRSVNPIEVANLVLWLLSNKSDAITGQNHRIDCGYQRALWDPLWTDKRLDSIYKP